MAPKKGGGENSKKAQGQARKAEAAAGKQAQKDADAVGSSDTVSAPLTGHDDHAIRAVDNDGGSDGRQDIQMAVYVSMYESDA